MFSVDGRLQPVVCLVHRELTPFVEEAVRRGEYRLLAVMEQAARELAALHAAAYEAMFLETVCAEAGWFANLNTPEEFREAELRWRGGEGLGEGAS
jgi:molybdopterin-guanine dinucleotide biosynthesis protein A